MSDRAFRDGQAHVWKALGRNGTTTRIPRCCRAGYSGVVDVGGCMEIDRASAQRIVAKLGVTLGFLFLLAIIALAFT